MKQKQIGFLILRFGISIVFLWFGFSQIFDSINWVGMIPEWAVNIINLPPAMIVLANGLFEVIFATLLIIGFKIRFAAFTLALHLAVITVIVGFNAIGVRDFGLTMATLALSFFGKGED